MGFAESFEKAYINSSAQSSQATLEAIKEKIKKEAETTEKANKLTAIKSSVVDMRERMIMSGQDTSAIDPFLQGISGVKDADVAEAFMKSALSSIEKQKSMSEQIIELSNLAKAGKDIGNRDLYNKASEAANAILGGQNQVQALHGTQTQIQPTSQPLVGTEVQPTTQQAQQPQQVNNTKVELDAAMQGPMSSNVSLEGIGAIEIDNFTGKETADGQRQKVANALIEERAKKGFEPLQSEAVSKYAGAVQGLSMIQKTVDNLGFYRDAKTGKVKTFDKNFGKKVAGSKAASFKEMTLPFSNIKVTGGLTEGLIQMAGTDDARKIDLWLQTLAEDVLRARTGAAAPEPERVREEQRSLLRLLDTPDVGFERLMTNEGFMRTVANQIRPGTVTPLSIPEGRVMVDSKGNRALVSTDGKKVLKEL